MARLWDSGALHRHELLTSHVIVTPGDCITDEPGFLRGHGTHVEDGRLMASVAGIVERVNKLVSVRPLSTRYSGEVGDVVVGRVKEVGSKLWKVDVNARQDGLLMLSSINLSGGVQRRRTVEDQLNMRSFFQENDVLSADVHSFMADGAIMLHARSLKYGKLENGHFLAVPPSLVKRLKQHFVTLPCGVDVILGKNGFLWISPAVDEDAVRALVGDDKAGSSLAEVIETRKRLQRDLDPTPEMRERLARVRNAIVTLRSALLPITPHAIVDVYDASLRLGLRAADMTDPTRLGVLTADVAGRREDDEDEEEEEAGEAGEEERGGGAGRSRRRAEEDEDEDEGDELDAEAVAAVVRAERAAQTTRGVRGLGPGLKEVDGEDGEGDGEEDEEEAGEEAEGRGRGVGGVGNVRRDGDDDDLF